MALQKAKNYKFILGFDILGENDMHQQKLEFTELGLRFYFLFTD